MNESPRSDRLHIFSLLAALSQLFCRRGKTAADVLRKADRALELVLVLVVLGITPLVYAVPSHWSILLNLFFLPVSISGFYLGRYRAGVMSVLCVLSATFVVFLRLIMTPGVSIFVDLMGVAVWGSVLVLTAMLIGTFSDERIRRYKKLSASHQTDTLVDPLTKIANRRAFEHELGQLLDDWEQHHMPFAVVILDLDNFKKLNDTYGHQAGDMVLHDVARSLETTIREVDMVARYGGEEFVILLRGATVDDAQETSERARTEIEVSRYFYERLKLRLTVSVGMSHVTPGDDAASIIKRADEALYTSKLAGRNCAHYHNGRQCEHYGAPLSRHHEMDRANQRKQPNLATDAYDDITGLPSRKVLIEELTRRVAEERRYKAILSLMLVQLDDFEQISILGDVVEMKILSMLGELTRTLMRDADLVVRYAPDQFGVLMPHTSQFNARGPAERLRIQVDTCDSVKHQGAPLELTISIGLAELAPVDDAASVLARATVALEEAIELGGNCLVVFCDGEPQRINASNT